MKIEFDRFPGGKRKALTFSYDDGNREGDKRLVEIFDKYGVKGTFHLNSGGMDGERNISASEAKELYKNHEISCHSKTHPFLENLPANVIAEEIMEDRRALEEISGNVVRGMSYPMGSYSDRAIEVLKNCGIEYSRTTVKTMGFKPPEDFMKWHPTCHHKEDLEMLLEKFLNLKFSTLPVFYIWGHSYEFVNEDNFDKMESFLEKAAGREEVWYATNIEIYDYITAVRSLKVSMDKKFIFNPTCTTVCISVDDKAVDIKPGNNILQ